MMGFLRLLLSLPFILAALPFYGIAAALATVANLIANGPETAYECWRDFMDLL